MVKPPMSRGDDMISECTLWRSLLRELNMLGFKVEINSLYFSSLSIRETCNVAPSSTGDSSFTADIASGDLDTQAKHDPLSETGEMKRTRIYMTVARN
ncbi:uncharacterized protein BcabD6B2_02510 [Babesia caballi]|uniref:Uncharacterized protein n=1 Tax=Babesia caballi TaxID=5871 RepID=A0AAV4LLZ0_BABCB|nr:hypothetical protein, conserved [Babesia caballi]